MSGNSSKIIALNYFGSKFSYLDELYANFPVDFTHLIDLFAGSFVVSLNYKGNVIKTANEINGEVTNFFTVLRDQPEALLKALQLTPVSEGEYIQCWDITGNPIERARRFFVRSRQSFCGMGTNKASKGFFMAKKNLACEGGEAVSKWKNAVPKLEQIARLLASNFQIVCGSWEKTMRRLDFPKAFFYQDPPYPYSCRKSRKDYRFEFTDDDHVKLAKANYKVKGKVMISSYQNDLYDDLYTAKGWTKIPLKNKKNNLSTDKVQETIWFNYPVHETRAGQQSLFN